MELSEYQDTNVILVKQDDTDWISCYLWQVECDVLLDIIREYGWHDRKVNTIYVTLFNRNFPTVKQLLYAEIFGHVSGNMEPANRYLLVSISWQFNISSFLDGLENIRLLHKITYQPRKEIVFGKLSRNYEHKWSLYEDFGNICEEYADSEEYTDRSGYFVTSGVGRVWLPYQNYPQPRIPLVGTPMMRQQISIKDIFELFTIDGSK